LVSVGLRQQSEIVVHYTPTTCNTCVRGSLWLARLIGEIGNRNEGAKSSRLASTREITPTIRRAGRTRGVSRRESRARQRGYRSRILTGDTPESRAPRRRPRAAAGIVSGASSAIRRRTIATSL